VRSVFGSTVLICHESCFHILKIFYNEGSSYKSSMPVSTLDSRESVLRKTHHGVQIACRVMEYTDVHGDHCERSCHKIAGKTLTSHVVTGASIALITLHFRGRALMIFRGFALRITEFMLVVYEK
jgi:hypothetical protein